MIALCHTNKTGALGYRSLTVDVQCYIVGLRLISTAWIRHRWAVSGFYPVHQRIPVTFTHEFDPIGILSILSYCKSRHLLRNYTYEVF